MFKEEITNLLSKHIKLGKKEIISLIEIPSALDFGDYSFLCFALAKHFKKSPKDIAEGLAGKLNKQKPKSIEDVKAVNGYVNFFIKKELLAEKILGQIFKEKEKYGHSTLKKGKRAVIESPGPNTNKPLHLGHLRNMALGISLSKLFTAIGYKVINVDIVNDRGIHIMKSMLAYKKYGKNKKPNKKPDHFIGDFYVLYTQKAKSHPELEEELKELLRKYEAKDKETMALLEKMNKWAMQGIEETYKRFGMGIDKFYFETKYYEKGKNIVQEHLKKGLFQREKDGSIVIDLTKQNLGKKILLRADGTAIYITQDMYLAIKRYQDYKMDKMVYVVGSEQIYHFKVLFTLLKLMKYKFVENYHHFPYGMVYLPEGKMKSREGTVVDADTLIDDLVNIAKIEIKKREPKIKKAELETRTEKIALGAIKFFILKFDALKDFIYDPTKSISFDGETGPYIQYAYARAASILRKAKIKTSPKFNKKVLMLKDNEAHLLVRELSKFPELVEKAAERIKPDMIANYTYKLAQTFTNFYTNVKVLTENPEDRAERLQLTAAARQVVANALALLDIEVLEKM